MLGAGRKQARYELFQQHLSPGEGTAAESSTQDRPQGKEIAARVLSASLEALRGQVLRRASHLALAGRRSVFTKARSAKVRQLEGPLGSQKDVGRLQISMEHALPMEVGEATRHLGAQGGHDDGGEGASVVEDRLEASTFHVLENQEGPPRLLPAIEEEHHPGIAESPQDLALPGEGGCQGRALPYAGPEALQDDPPRSAGPPRQVEDRDGPTSQLRQHLVGPDGCDRRLHPRWRSETPDITGGWGNPKRANMVGATSQMRPPARSWACPSESLT